MYRVILACACVTPDAGPTAARDITEDFTHRPWHSNAKCEWDGSRLILQADNDFDSNGLALLDEFSDAISAYIREPIDGDIEIVSVTVLPTTQE
jgi:hypothetical protein